MSSDDIWSEPSDERMWSGHEEEARSEPEEDPVSEPTFRKVRRGYDPDEVSGYLETLSTRVRTLESHAAEVESDLDQARRQLRDVASATKDPYDAISARMADVMRSFDQEVERQRGEVYAEAAQILDEARAEADRVRLDAQARAEEVSAEAARAAQEARAQADELLSGLELRRSSLLVEIRALKDRMLEAARAMIPPTYDDLPDEIVIVDDDAVSERTRGSQ